MKTCVLLVALLVAVSSGNQAAPATLEQTADAIFRTIWHFHPVDASYYGLGEFDTLLADYSKKSLRSMVSKCQQHKRMLSEIDTSVLSIDEKVDCQLLNIFLESELFALEKKKAYENDPLVYVQECVYGVYTLLKHPLSSTKLNAIKMRLDQTPRFLEDARANLKHPPQILCDIGIEQLSGGERLIEDVYATHKGSMPSHKRTEFQTSMNRAIAAMEGFALWLKKHAAAQRSPALGKENFEYKLRTIHLIDIDADSLLSVGSGVLDSVNMMIDSLEVLYTSPAATRVMVPLDFGKDDVLEYQREEIAYVRDFILRHNLVTVPDWIGDLEIVETPAFLSGLIPGVAMVPPAPFDTSGVSLFYTPPIPDRFDRGTTEYYFNYVHNRWFRTSVIHEAYPGHHLQLSLARAHRSPVRKGFGDYFFIEGWALYCEELMAGSGLSEDTLGAVITMLYGLRFRAARVVVDVMLQTGQFTYDEAVDFMSKNSRRGQTALTKEVRRYITNPGQPSSYLIGKLQILQLLDDYKRAQGEAFELRKFHDELLSHGSIPVSLVRRLMMP